MKRFILIFILFFLNSCSLNSGAKPEITIADVKFSGVTLFETSADFTVRIQNENPFELSFEGAKHNIYLNGINVGTGLIDNSFTVPKLGTTTQTVKIHLSNLSLVRNIQKLIDAKEFDYKIESTLFKSGGFGLNNLNVTETGTFKSLY
jgi:LEA14-like dessication related protein